MSILVSGSLAIDYIMVFRDRFKNHILPDRLHVLNVAFHVPTLRRSFGGTAGNIAYHLRLLGDDPLLLASVGSDFSPYAEWLDRHGIDRRFVRTYDDLLTAQAFITTDLDDNQITAFHSGAMERANDLKVDDVTDAVALGIVSPNAKQAMLFLVTLAFLVVAKIGNLYSSYSVENFQIIMENLKRQIAALAEGES